MTRYTIQTLKGHSKSQDLIINAFVTPGLKEIWVANGSKYGKANYIEQLIYTTEGIKRFGDLQEGDHVFDENGKPTKITYVTDTMYDHDCYEVVFQDSQKLIADAEHLWFTKTHAERKNEARNKSGKKYGQVRTTLELLETLHHIDRTHKRPNHSIPLVTNPIELPEQNLPIDPYLLGLWLGDGDSNGGKLTICSDHAEVILKHLNDKCVYNHVLDRSKPEVYKAERIRIKNLTTQLREFNLIKNKHIPSHYLIGSPEQRLELLRGLMDTDGTICKRGHCTFDNTNIDLAKGVMDLAMSLGIKAHWHERIGKLYGVEKKTCYRVMFTTDIPVFKVKQKLERIRPVQSKSKNRYITEINKVPSVPVKCIKVENPTSLFLIGKGCIPTHNTIAAVNTMIAKAPITSNAVFRWIAPIYSQSLIGMRYFRRFLPKTKHIQFNKSEPSIIFDPINTRIEFRTGKDPESLEGEATAGNILDECSKMTEEVYASTRTTTTVTRGPIMAISTPRGKNWFYNRCMAAKEEMEWALANNKTPHRIFIQAPTTDNPYVSKEAVMDAQKSLPRRLFRQYFLAEFVDSGSTFADFRKCLYNDRIEMLPGKERWFDESMPKNKDGKYDIKVVIGADWAKKIDYTVFTAWDYKKKKMVGFWRFQGVNYIEAIKKVYHFGKQFADVELLIHDQTGIGEVIADLLDKTGFPHQGITFTSKNKTFMVNNLIISFEQRDVQIPFWPEMVQELDAYEVQTNEIGTMKFSAPNGMHDDIVSSMILGWAAVCDYSTTEMSVKIIEELKTNTYSAGDWINDYKDEDEEVQPWEKLIIRPK